MKAPLTLPRLGETMESGRVVAWLKQPGERFARGEVIAEIETDKTTVELPALDSGELTEILAPEGSIVAVGAALGHYRPDGAPAAALPARLVDLELPRLGETMESGRVVAWLKQPGDSFTRGEIIVEIETDKTTVEFPALADGRLVEILVREGEAVDVGTPIGRYESAEAGDDAALQPTPAPAEDRTEATPTRSVATEGRLTQQAALPGTRRRATPLARRMARSAGLDLATLAGTGRRGRIERGDVEAALATSARAPASTSAALPDSSPSLQRVALAGGDLAFRTWGPATAARTLVLVHGFAGDGLTWSGLAGHLARTGVRVIAPDLPGHGATTLPADDLDDLATALAAFLMKLGLAGADLVGHSLGGAAVVRAAGKPGLDARSLTLIAPAGLGGEIDADFITGIARVASGGALSHLLRRIARRPPILSRAELDRMAVAVGGGRLTALAGALVADGRQQIDIVPDLAGAPTPTRLLWGLEDRIIPWTQVADAPSRVAIHLIPSAGHMPHWDAPQEIAALLA